ncbi:U6 snRNA phosphodiesterase Usb1 [Limtongia smithiae]|uniref:U6 snRNA phosphodiesterase Usb1 n=1 Tax=Limtongia smithiae TaxID=1125753 RepID=UPI0034CFB660
MPQHDPAHTRDAAAVTRPPPIPATLLDLFTTAPRRFSSHTLHDGRVRKFPHAPESWAALVYLDWLPCAARAAALENAVAIAVAAEAERADGRTVHSLVFSGEGVAQTLHLSLSPPIQLVGLATRNLFVACVRSALAAARPGDRVLTVRFRAAARWVANPERSREFLVVETAGANAGLDALGRAVQRVCSEMDVPWFAMWRPHVSIAWRAADAQRPAERIDELPEDHGEEDAEASFAVRFEGAKVKTGNRVHRVAME